MKITKKSKAQIVATLGPVSSNEKTLRAMMEHNLDVVRLNFSWSDIKNHERQIELVRKLERELNRRIPIIIDLPDKIDYLDKKDRYSEFDWLRQLAPPRTIQCSTSCSNYQALYLNIFRGEPAISGFVWHIAPNLKSSQNIAAFTSADLLPKFFGTHPAQG